jgi:hypothetical protein
MESSTNLYISQLVADNPHVPTEYNNKGRHKAHNGYDGGSHHHLSFFHLLPTEIDSDPLNYFRLTTSHTEGMNYTMEFLVPKHPSHGNEIKVNKLDFNDKVTYVNSSYPKINNSPEKRFSSSKQQFEAKCKCDKYCWSGEIYRHIIHNIRNCCCNSYVY